MRHYHGTPIGGKRTSAAEFATGRFLLVPWRRPEDLKLACELSRGFVVDNSAYTFWRTKEQPDWMEYINWCRTIARNPRFDFALVPDVIGGTEAENDALIRLWDKHAWYPIKIEGCPVWHLHESFERLARLVSRWDRVALGSSGQWPTPGVGDWWRRMDDAWDVICDGDGLPRAKIHGLRMLRGDIVERYPFTSGDSTNATQNGSRLAKSLAVDSAWGQMTNARRIESRMSPSRWLYARRPQQYSLFDGVEEPKL